MSPPIEATTESLAARLIAAREPPPSIEARLMLAGLGERMFGLPSEPLQLGRYTVLRRLGAGGMGVVYLAHDAELDRDIAIKLLRVRDDDARERAATRLLREARALARVDHPNVIAVHEVGDHDGDVFIAMDLVDGVTLATWQAEPHPWRAVVELYAQAGRGLAAAHAAGVVHRDFKPGNVIVGDDGRGGRRARVVDFGLARAGGDDPEPITPATAPELHPRSASLTTTVDPASDVPRGAPPSSTLTATGALLGTPAYMAPEQFLGRQADARSDQFSFALALHEGLCGARAFAGDTIDELWAAVIAGRRRSPPPGRRPPRWLRRVIDRALSTAPERRYPSMPALLADLERGLHRGRRRLLALGAAAMVLGAAMAGRSSTPDPCARGPASIAEVWNDPTRAAAEAAFLATHRPFAAHAWARSDATLHAYADEWARAYQQTCAATHHDGAQSDAALDLRMGCLERRRDELAALLAVFREADERTVTRAVEASEALTPITTCADLDVLRSLGVPEDPRLRASVAVLRGELARARALRDSGHYDEAIALAEHADADARRLGDRPIQAEAGVMLASLQALRGAIEPAAASLDRAFLDALACDHVEMAAWSAIAATHVVGALARRGGEGRRWAALAAPMIERLGDDARATVSLRANLGNLAFAGGALDEAREHFEAALARVEPDHLLAANIHGNLAAVLRRTGDHTGALAHYRRAGEVFRARLGPGHPALATLANNTGVLLQTMGEHEAAARAYHEVLALAGATLSPTSPTLAHAHGNLGELLGERGDPRAAVPHLEAAIAIWTSTRGDGDPLVGQLLVQLGRAQVELLDPDPALRSLQRALEILRSTHAAPADIAAAQFEQARALALTAPNDLDEAIQTARTAAAALPPGDTRAKIDAWLAARTRP